MYIAHKTDTTVLVHTSKLLFFANPDATRMTMLVLKAYSIVGYQIEVVTKMHPLPIMILANETRLPIKITEKA